MCSGLSQFVGAENRSSWINDKYARWYTPKNVKHVDAVFWAFVDGLLRTFVLALIIHVHTLICIYRSNNTNIENKCHFQYLCQKCTKCSPKYMKHVISVIGHNLQHGFDDKLWQNHRVFSYVAICDCRNVWWFKTTTPQINTHSRWAL